jgi:hypothetical protein
VIYKFYSLPIIVLMVKSRRMRWASHVALKKERMTAYRLLVGKPRGRSYYGDQDIDGWIILKCILGRQYTMGWYELD